MNENLKQKVESKEEEISFIKDQEQKQRKAVTAALKSAEKISKTLDNRVGRFEAHRKCKEDVLRTVKAVAKVKVKSVSEKREADTKRHKKRYINSSDLTIGI